MRTLVSLPLLLLLATAGCHGSRKATGPRRAGDVPTYDGLFTTGTSWRLAVTTTSSHWDDQDPAADEHGNVDSSSKHEMTCRVRATRRFPGGRAAEIECDEGGRAADPIAGVWIQTADGLWRGELLPEEGVTPALDVGRRFLAARPEPVDKREEEPESPDGPSGGSGSTLTITADGDGWCVSESSWGGDESWQSLCLDDDGPSSGGGGWAGGSSSEYEFTRIEPTR